MNVGAVGQGEDVGVGMTEDVHRRPVAFARLSAAVAYQCEAGQPMHKAPRDGFQDARRERPQERRSGRRWVSFIVDTSMKDQGVTNKLDVRGSTRRDGI